MKTPCKLIKLNSEYILISDDLFGKEDLVYTNEKGRPVMGKVEKVLIGKFAMVNLGGVVHRFFHCRKVIARESDILAISKTVDYGFGFSYARISMFNHEKAEEIIKNRLNCYVIVEDGKLIDANKITLFVSEKGNKLAK